MSAKRILSIIIPAALIIIIILIITGKVSLTNSGNKTSDKVINATFLCDKGKSITAVFYNGKNNHVELKLSDGRNLSLPHAISADGGRYADKDERTVFWNTGDTAFVTDGNKTTYENCSDQAVSIPKDRITSVDSNSEITFRYSETLKAKYIYPQDWPPKIRILKQSYTCKEAGNETSPAGITQKTFINDHEYCVTKKSQGTAGSTYTQYTYAFAKDNKTIILTFSLRFLQCANYPEPEKSKCAEERSKFNIDEAINRVAQVVTAKLD